MTARDSSPPSPRAPEHRAAAAADWRRALVLRTLGSLLRRLPRHVDVNDVVAAGLLGLVEAEARFDRCRGVGFEAFAALRIRGAALDELRRMDMMSREGRERARRLERCRDELARRGEPTDLEAVASAAGIQPQTVHRFVPVQVVGGSELERIPCTRRPSTLELVQAKRRRERLHAGLGRLGERERFVVEQHYLHGRRQRCIGRELGVSESRVCQILSSARRRLQRDLKGGG